MKLTPKILTDLFAKPASKDDPRKTEAALAAARALVADAERELAAAEQDHERRAPDALAAGDAALLDQLAAAIGEARRRLEATAATCRAVERRHEAACAAADAATIAARWKAAGQLKQASDEKATRVQEAAEALARALDDLIASHDALLLALPIKPKSLPLGFGASLVPFVLRWLAGCSPTFARFSPMESAHVIRTGRSLADQVRDIGDYLLAGDPQRSNTEDAA